MKQKIISLDGDFFVHIISKLSIRFPVQNAIYVLFLRDAKTNISLRITSKMDQNSSRSLKISVFLYGLNNIGDLD